MSWITRSEKFYDPTVDYKTRHLQWLARKDNKNFTLTVTRSDKVDQVSEWTHWNIVYTHHPHLTNEFAYKMYMECVTKRDRDELVRKEEKEMVAQILEVQPETRKWFVTIGFDRENYRDCTAIDCINKLLTEYDWVTSAHGVMEFYGSTGWRPHFMIGMEIPVEYKSARGNIVKMCKSNVIKLLGKSAGFRRTKLIGPTDKDIQVEPFVQRYVPYLRLDKAADKLEFLQRDEEYRQRNSIPAEFRKEVFEFV